MFNIIEHLYNPVELVRQAKKLLSKNGKLILLCPTWHAKPVLEFLNFKTPFMSDNSRASLDEHKTYYDKRSLWQLLINAGFVSSEIKSVKLKKFIFSVEAIAERS